MEELLLWRWSTTAQVLSVLLVTVFFLIIRRSTRRRGMGSWTLAWLANCGAMAATLVYWFAQPEGLPNRLVTGAYFFSKTLFVLLLVIGALAFARPAALVPPAWALALLAGVFALGMAASAPGIDAVGVAQAGLIAAVVLPGAWFCATHRGEGLGWLGVGLGLRGVLALMETVAYGLRMAGSDALPADLLDFFLGAHSLFDTGAEWAIALGIVLALAHRTLHELRRSHDELEAAHRKLREMADTDPLTGLANRRLLPALWHGATAPGATVLFFDLDGFKRINDAEGHFAGDACLRRFAAALRESFPAQAAIARFAGDEFVVVAPGLSRADVEIHLDQLRERVGSVADGVSGMSFSVGMAEVRPGDGLDEGVGLADRDMYARRAARRAG